MAITQYGEKSGWGTNADKIMNGRHGKITNKVHDNDDVNEILDKVIFFNTVKTAFPDEYNRKIKSLNTPLSTFFYNKFASGGFARNTGFAWLDGTPTQPEAVLSAKDTKNFVALKDALADIANGNNGLSDIINSSNGASNVIGNLAKINSLKSFDTGNTNIGNVTYETNIAIDRVQDYDDFVNQMRQDNKFEKMIQSMTVDRLSGGTQMSKNKYKW